MKKAICLLAALMLLCSCALAEVVYNGPTEAAMQLNPNGYDRLRVVDIFSNTDEGIDSGVCVQGCFGTINMDDELDPDFIGFDYGDIRVMGLADNCEIWMPADVMNPVENVRVEDLEGWFSDFGRNEFYAEFEIDEAGDLVYLAFIYYPFG
ncbi:MAG: hypothetical protein CW338_01925 [Clostridiales bacterium]|nr:hypothetical protein [Clostridiales bacterium]